MATKNLARTVIEGGRTSDYKEEVADLIRAERSATRSFLNVARLDAGATDGVPHPRRKPSRPTFADKLGPIRAFLDRRVGTSWDETRSILTARFDTRTTPGRHVLHAHVLGDVALNGEHLLDTTTNWIRHRYFVDDRGLLRRNPRKVYKHVDALRQRSMSTPEVLAFLRDRRVGRLGSRYVWFEPVRSLGDVRLVIDAYNSPIWATVGPDGRVVHEPVDPTDPRRQAWMPPTTPILRSSVPFRASGLLTHDEEERFLSIPDVVRDRVLRAVQDQR